MNEIRLWEYRVETLGSAWKKQADEELEGILNEWGEEGWELVSMEFFPSENRVRAVGKRPLTSRNRRQRMTIEGSSFNE
jgi:hypothetical protein